MPAAGCDHLRDDELFATLADLAGYHIARADLRRTDESLRAGVGEGRQWFRPAIEARFGAVACLRGKFAAAASHLEAGTAATDQQQIEAVWFQPNDPIAVAYIHLAFIHSVRGDLAGADAELAHAARRVESTPASTAPTRCRL